MERFRHGVTRYGVLIVLVGAVALLPLAAWDDQLASRVGQALVAVGFVAMAVAAVVRWRTGPAASSE